MLTLAAVAMGLVEIVGGFTEAAYAFVLSGVFLLLALWFSRRASRWAAVALAIFFLLEVLYLGDYDWGDTDDRVMMIVTVVVSAAGLVAAAVWLVQSRRTA